MDAFGRFRTRLDVFGRFRTFSDAFGRFWTLLDTFGHFRTLFGPFRTRPLVKRIRVAILFASTFADFFFSSRFVLVMNLGVVFAGSRLVLVEFWGGFCWS